MCGYDVHLKLISKLIWVSEVFSFSDSAMALAPSIPMLFFVAKIWTIKNIIYVSQRRRFLSETFTFNASAMFLAPSVSILFMKRCKM